MKSYTVITWAGWNDVENPVTREEGLTFQEAITAFNYYKFQGSVNGLSLDAIQIYCLDKGVRVWGEYVEL